MDKFQGFHVISAGSDGNFLSVFLLFKTILLVLTNLFFIEGFRFIVPGIGFFGTLAFMIFTLRYPPFYKTIANAAFGTVLGFASGGFLASLIAESKSGWEYSLLFFLAGIPIVLLYYIMFFIRTLIFKSYIEAQLESTLTGDDYFSFFKTWDFDYAAQIMPRYRDLLYKIGYEKYKTSLRMKMYYCTFLLETGENRHMIHQLTQPHSRLSIFEFDLSFFYLYCKNKKQEREMVNKHGNKRITISLRRVKKNCIKVKNLLQQLWGTAAEENPSFKHFPDVISTIEYLEEKCRKILDDTLRLDPNHVGTLRAYGTQFRFMLLTIQQEHLKQKLDEIISKRKITSTKQNLRKEEQNEYIT